MHMPVVKVWILFPMLKKLLTLHDSCIFAVLPRIYVHPKAKIVEINNDSTSVTFFCMADEASSYYWLRETGSIPSDATGVETNKLTLHSILPLDSGHYQCVAENENGKTYSNYAMFTVIGKNLNEKLKIMFT